jgi:hypothetical protein
MRSDGHSVTLCKLCDSLDDQSQAADPHPSLMCERSEAHADGKLDTFTCQACGTRWERLSLPKQVLPGPRLHVWRRI